MHPVAAIKTPHLHLIRDSAPEAPTREKSDRKNNETQTRRLRHSGGAQARRSAVAEICAPGIVIVLVYYSGGRVVRKRVVCIQILAPHDVIGCIDNMIIVVIAI